MLFQKKYDDERPIISYASAKLNKTERRYHINGIECLAVVWAIKKWKHFLHNAPFTLSTDNSALTWLDRVKDERAKLTRWALLFQGYSFKIIHILGRSSQLPDFLSRNLENKETRIDIELDSEIMFSLRKIISPSRLKKSRGL
ncbi:hypothetical protein JTB14_008491 [Gonioctena quinquepunctata]|nr:hypothetical protein JTB14_008491 [Gonioctena quinquepunctata]